MTNFNIFVDYASKMIKSSNKMAVVGLVGSGLTKKEVKAAAKKAIKKSGTKVNKVTYTSSSVMFELV